MRFVVKTAFSADNKNYEIGDVVTREKMGSNLDVAVRRGIVVVFESKEVYEIDVLDAFLVGFVESGKGSE